MRVEGLWHNFFTVLLLPGRADLGHRPRGAAVAGARRRPPAGRPAQPHHVPRHEPPVPGRDDVGHVPPRRRAGPGPHRPVGAARARCRDRPARASAGLDQSRRLARPGARDLRLGALLASSCCPASAAARARRPTSSPSWSAGWPPSATRWTRPPARSSPTTRSGWPRPAGSRRWRCPTSRRRTSWTSRAIRRSPGRASSSSSAASTGGGRTSSTRTCRTRTASGSSTSDPVPPACPIHSRTTRAFEIVCP